MGSPPLWSLSCSLPLLLLLRPWLDPGGAPASLLEAPTGSQSMPTAQPSTTLSTRLPTTSSRTTLPARSPGWPKVPKTSYFFSRDGDTVTGSYNYVNPAGTLVTVNYEAGPDGFKQETSEQKGAVEMRNVPVGWNGPLAGVDDAGSVSSGVSATRQSSSSLSQSDLIAKILATLQPRITSAV